jgi:hypothetical protein
MRGGWRALHGAAPRAVPPRVQLRAQRADGASDPQPLSPQLPARPSLPPLAATVATADVSVAEATLPAGRVELTVTVAPASVAAAGMALTQVLKMIENRFEMWRVDHRG